MFSILYLSGSVQLEGSEGIYKVLSEGLVAGVHGSVIESCSALKGAFEFKQSGGFPKLRAPFWESL